MQYGCTKDFYHSRSVKAQFVGAVFRYSKAFFASLLFIAILTSHNVFADGIEIVNVSRDRQTLRLLIVSRDPLDYNFATRKNGKAISLSLSGADYYKALTDYFTLFDIDSLLGCMDNLAIIPISKNAARFEADLGEGLEAEVLQSRAPSGAQRLVLEINNASGDAPCFAKPVPRALRPDPSLFIVAPVTPSLTEPPAIEAASAGEPTAEDIVKSQQGDQVSGLETASSGHMKAFARETASSKMQWQAGFSLDSLAYSNKGGIKGVNWLKKYGDSEIREITASIRNERARIPYYLSMESFTEYIRDGQRVDERKFEINRAWAGYRLTPAVTVKAGIMYEPFVGESSTDKSSLPFLEKGLNNILSPQYNPGVMLSYYRGAWEMEAGGFGQRQDFADTSQSTSTRFAYLYRRGLTDLSKFEFSFSNIKLVDDELNIAASPDANLILPLYNVSQANVSSATRAGLGVVVIYGGINYSVQAVQMKLNTPNPGLKKLNAKNFWVSWLSGSPKRILKNQRWLPVTSRKSISEVDWSRWEVGFRYSSIDDNTTEQMITKTIMMNWYINQHVILKANYIFASQVANSLYNRPLDNDADLFVIRLQFNW